MYNILMKFRDFRRAAVCLAAALFIGGAWFFHMAEAHNAADNDCQVCATACSPELNSDCGTVLIARPETSGSAVPLLSVMPARPAEAFGFYGRAPPLV